MSRRATMQECCQAVEELFPDLPKPEQTALGALVCGVVHAESAQLSRASAARPALPVGLLPSTPRSYHVRRVRHVPSATLVGYSREADMTPVDWRDYITADEKILAGKPIVKGTRLSVEFVLELLAAGWDRDALHDNYPQLTEDRIRAVLAYAARA